MRPSGAFCGKADKRRKQRFIDFYSGEVIAAAYVNLRADQAGQILFIGY